MDKKGVVYINKPIENKDEDIIGISKYAEKIVEAMNNGAQIIGITSNFGTGKSSLVKMLENERSNDSFVYISMWPKLCNENTDEEFKSIDLHKYFLYQLVSRFNNKKASYISKKYNESFGLIKAISNNKSNNIFLFGAMFAFILAFVFSKFFASQTSPLFDWKYENIATFLYLISITTICYIVSKSSILFSSKNSEGIRTVQSLDIIEDYKNYVVPELKKNSTTILVIEDLDRIENSHTISFLKEIRKYYLISRKDNDAKIVFIVNVKPESLLDTDECNLYSKIFDYVINLQEVNIVDYSIILGQLIAQKDPEIRELLKVKSDYELLKFPGIEWVIYGKKLELRTVKDRLNKTFALYEALVDKYGKDANIEFEKCAASVYLTSTYEKDFAFTNDSDFDELVNAFIVGKLNAQIVAILDKCTEEYKDAVTSFIERRLIDDQYHMYYYNFPKNSHIYTTSEIFVRNAILYDDDTDNFDEVVNTVSIVMVKKFIERAKNIKKKLSTNIICNKYIHKALKESYPESITVWLNNLNYDEDNIDLSCKRILDLLDTDEAYHSLNADSTFSYCSVWNSKNDIDESSILAIRREICKNFPTYVMLFKPLYLNGHKMITPLEIDNIGLSDALHLIFSSKDFLNKDGLNSLLKKYDGNNIPNESERIVVLLERMSESSESDIDVDDVFSFIEKCGNIPKALEKIIIEAIAEDSTGELKNKYIESINSIDATLISKHTMENICNYKCYKGLSKTVTYKLVQEGFVLDAIYICIENNYSIDFLNNASIVNIVKQYANKNSKDVILYRLRKIISNSNKETIDFYSFLYKRPFNPIDEEELEDILDRTSALKAMELLQPENLDNESYRKIIKKINSSIHSKTETYYMLLEISKWPVVFAQAAFSEIDFRLAKYSTIGKERKKEIKEAVYGKLNLDTSIGKVSYMLYTNFIDSEYDEAISSRVATDEDLQKEYYQLVNNENISVDDFSKYTIANILKIKKKQGVRPAVYKKMRELGKPKNYVIGKTLWNGTFEFEDEPELWITYMSIFKSIEDSDTIAYMSENVAFLNEAIDRKEYIGLNQEVFYRFRKAIQTKESVDNVLMFNNTTFAVNYFSAISGFDNEETEMHFIDSIRANSRLILSKAIYDNVYSKLSKANKTRYTKAINIQTK